MGLASKNTYKFLSQFFLILSAFNISGCGGGKSQSNYVYRNPDKGGEVELKAQTDKNRLSTSTPQTVQKVRIFDGYFQVDLKTKKASFRLKKETTKSASTQTEEIILRGTLDSDYKGWIEDTSYSQNKTARAIAYVRCFPDGKGNFCATSYVSVRYPDENFQIKEQQFHANPRAEIIQKRKDKQTPGKKSKPVEDSPNQASNSGKDKSTVPTLIASSPILNDVKPQQTVEPKAEPKIEIVDHIDENELSILSEVIADPVLEVETDLALNELDLKEGETHIEDDTNDSTFITPQLPEELEKKLVPQPKAPQPAIKSGPSNPAETAQTVIVNLNLSQGGISVLNPNNGYIKAATLMPPSGAGFKRHSEDAKAYASGFLVSFIQESARRFALDNPNCSSLQINQISLRRGGFFKGHSSHRNGSDIDVSYFQRTPWQNMVTTTKVTAVDKKGRKRVLYRSTTRPEFNHDCFLKFLKFIDDQKFTNTKDSRFDGSDIVDLVFVNAGIQNGVCSYVKKNGLKDKYRDAINLMYPEDGHNKHFHIRLRCSPKHIDCENRDFDRSPPFQKRGCRL